MRTSSYLHTIKMVQDPRNQCRDIIKYHITAIFDVMMVQQAILFDHMHERHGIDKEESNHYINKEDLLSIPVVSVR